MTTYTTADEYLRDARKFGLAEASGALQRPDFFVKTAIAGEDGVIKPADATKAWDQFANSKLRNNKLENVVVLDDNFRADKQGNMHAVRASELKQVIIAAG